MSTRMSVPQKGLILWGLLWAFGVQAAEYVPFPTMSFRELPQGLQEQYLHNKPEMTPMSHCAAAFDSYTDGDKMAFRCSIYIKMSAEGERRAMKYCEERKEQLQVKSPCRLIVEP
jgi:hypothetical protein